MHPCSYIVDHLLHVLTIQNPSVERECHDLPRNELAGFLQRLLRGHFEPTAARDLHAHDGDGLDVVLAQDLRRLLRVVHFSQDWGIRQSSPCRA